MLFATSIQTLRTLSLKELLRRLVLSFGRGLALGFVVICATLFFGQEQLLFPGTQHTDQWLRQARERDRVQIQTASETLEGWWTHNPRAKHDITILYFGGNGEDVLMTSGSVGGLGRIEARRMLFVNYRGYGQSTGKPSQAAIYADALAIYDFSVTHGAKPGSIVLMGRSLGSGVATRLAAARQVRATLLVTPYDSIESVAAQLYWFAPVKLLCRHPFPSVDWAAKVETPALFLVAGKDEVIPPSHALKLRDAWAGTTRLRMLEGMGHNDLDLHPDYYAEINLFLEKLMAGEIPAPSKH